MSSQRSIARTCHIGKPCRCRPSSISKFTHAYIACAIEPQMIIIPPCAFGSRRIRQGFNTPSSKDHGPSRASRDIGLGTPETQ